MPDNTRVDHLLARIKNNRVIAFLAVSGILLLAVVSVAEGISKAGELFGKAFAKQQFVATYDSQTIEALIEVAYKIDLFLLRAIDSPQPPRYADFAADYLVINADIRSMLLRNETRSVNNNDEAVKQIGQLLSNWETIGETLKAQDSGVLLSEREANEILKAMDQNRKNKLKQIRVAILNVLTTMLSNGYRTRV